MPKKTQSKKVEVKEVTQKPSDYNKILRNFLIAAAIIIALIIGIVYVVKSTNKFEYEGVKFEIVKSGDLVLYNTKLPVLVDGQKRDYNFYLRTDPRKLGAEVPFEGNLSLAQVLVLNSTKDFNCDGYGVIAVANLVNLYKISGINVIKDTKAKCDAEGRYAFINLQEGNDTKVTEVGPACYTVSIKDCQILEGTERLMLESFIKINKLR